jgi:hypothetical protein
MNAAAARYGDFARQLEHVATAAAFSSKLSQLERQIAARRASQKAAWSRVGQSLMVVKRVTMAFALAAAFLQYYALDVGVRVMAMQPVAYAHTAGM